MRFVGDTGYVVTFRQIDPLYTLDLANPESPRVLGELKIPGYSAYLHPIGEDLLLGVGQDATEEGRATGTQISIFDVSDLRKPTRVHQEALGIGLVGGRARPPRVPLLAAQRARDDPVQPEAVGFKVGRARGIDSLGRVEHDNAYPIRRSLVVRDSVVTVSERASSRAASRRWPSAAGPRSRRSSSRSQACPLASAAGGL